MKPEPSAELRERFEKWQDWETSSITRTLLWECWQAAQPTQAQLAEAARRIAEEAKTLVFPIPEHVIERILTDTLIAKFQSSPE